MKLFTVSAPGKLILFGEHAVVYGKDAIAVAIDLKTRCSISRSDRFLVNSQPLNDTDHPYILCATKMLWRGTPLHFKTHSRIPIGAGLGSSAAISVVTIGALLRLQQRFNEEDIARTGFKVEYKVQEGMASPIDSSICTHGGAILVSSTQQSDLLWQIKTDKKEWYIHHFDMPDLKFVIGYTGIFASTKTMVEKVSRFYSRSAFAREIVDEIGSITKTAVNALKDHDIVTLGKLMNRNHKLLSILGVSCEALETLIDACKKYSYGAKLTGGGGGGSIVALTDHIDDVAHTIEKFGATPFVVKISKKGVTVE
jgi:mevalonate kinase